MGSPYGNIVYAPKAGETNVVNPKDCQSMCADLDGCNHFLWDPVFRYCYFMESYEPPFDNLHYYRGPARCRIDIQFDNGK